MTAEAATTTRVPHRRSTTAWTLGAPAVIAAVSAAIALSWRDDLPDPVATHFGPSGVPDNFGSVTPHVVAPSIITMAFAAGMWAVGYFFGRSAATRRMANAVAVWFAIVIMGTIAGSLALQRGLDDATQAPDPQGFVLAAFGVGTVLAVLVAALTPGDARQPTAAPIPADAPVLPLGADEHATWVREVGQSGLLGVILGVLALTATIAWLADAWWTLLIGVVIAASLTAIVRWTVTVDQAGLTVRSLYRRPRVHVPLDEVLLAAVVQVDPLREFGGWGMRIGRGGRVGVVVRKGEGIQVERTGGRVVVVTVDDAATGAALLNSLAARSR